MANIYNNIPDMVKNEFEKPEQPKVETQPQPKVEQPKDEWKQTKMASGVLHELGDKRINEEWNDDFTKKQFKVGGTNGKIYGTLEEAKSSFDKPQPQLDQTKQVIRKWGYDPEQKFTNEQLDDLISQLEKEQDVSNFYKGQDGKFYDRNSGREVRENMNKEIIDAFKSLKQPQEPTYEQIMDALREETKERPLGSIYDYYTIATALTVADEYKDDPALISRMVERAKPILAKMPDSNVKNQIMAKLKIK